MSASYHITQLVIYPVKGLSGISIEKSFVGTRGLQYDRRWMLIDENNLFITQRSFPQLCLFKVEIEKPGFKITYNDKSILIPFEIEHGEHIKVKIWDDEVDALLANERINTFFSTLLAHRCSLVYMPDHSHRQIDKNFVNEEMPVSFADGYPVLMIGEASLNLLNTKLATPIEMDRFRPNIVFEGGEAHQEDLMKRFYIAGVEFRGVKPCGRCQVPTINQKTGLTGKEPISTLASYRSFDHKIKFGQNVIVLKEGNIALGDKIVLEN